MRKKEGITFLILAFNFLITGFIVGRPAWLANDILFVLVALGAAYGITKYVFIISRGMEKKDGDQQ